MKYLLMTREIVLGPRDEQGRIRPARPAIIIGATVAILGVLTWLTRGYIWFFVVVAGIWIWLIISTRKDERRAKVRAAKTQRIREALGGSAVTSTNEVARHTGLDRGEVETLIGEMITSANAGRKAADETIQFLRNAKLDVIAHKVTLDPQATASRAQRLGASASAVLDRFAPAKDEPRPAWQCGFCRSTNTGEAASCEKCGAGRSA